MKSAKAKPVRQPSRSGKRIQRLPISKDMREALETEFWFRQNHPRYRGTDVQDIFQEAIAWFLKWHKAQAPSGYENIDSHWPSVSFWLDNQLLERCRALARRDGISKRRVIGTALALYCHQFIPPAFKVFRHETARRALRLYTQHRSRAARKKPMPKKAS
jgi:hypothetical protein